MKKRKKIKEITVYDELDTTGMIDKNNPLSYEDIGLKLPPGPPSTVISIRLPSKLLNAIKALGSEQDVPYQSLIKIFLSKAVAEELKKAS